MKKNILPLLVIFLFLTCYLAPLINATEIKHFISNNSIYYVGGTGPGNFTTIQGAIDVASNGDTIFVFSGIYYENIVIDKSIYLIGENKTNTIIDGKGKNDAITINSQNTTIQGFTIINATGSGIYKIFRAGIRIIGSNNIIKSNIIKDNNAGLFIRRATNTIVNDNQFYNNGIILSPYDVIESHITLSTQYFIHTIENNTVNGKKILYLKNQKDILLPNEIGQLLTFNCSNISVQNINFTKCDFALLLAYTNNCIIKKSTFINDADIWLIECNRNLFEYNTMINNFHGITLDYHSKYNVMRYSNFSNNQLMGVMLEKNSNFNIIEKNNLMTNNYSNAFIQNSFMNKWNNNYWSDWIGLKYPVLRFFPKILFGRLFQEIKVIPLFNFDWHPALKPYEI